jgi:hypothetical protein
MKNYCIDCKKELKTRKAKRCLSCRHKGILHCNWKGGKPKCIKCGIEIDYRAKICQKCLNRTGSNNPRFIDGRKKRKHKCIICKKINISYETFFRGKKKCKKCYIKSLKGQGNPNYNNHKLNKNTVARHHINLNKKNNSSNNILFINISKHRTLHAKGYDYLVVTGQIRKYMKWFDRKFGLK